MRFIDACLFPHADFPGFPRAGRIFPQGLWPNGQITADMPPMANIIAAAKACIGCPLVYFDEFGGAPGVWTDMTPANIQTTLDHRAALTKIVRDVVGPSVRIGHFGFPVYGDMALRNYVLPWLSQVPSDQAYRASRWQYDVVNNRPVRGHLRNLIDYAAIGMYWNGDSAMYLPGVTDPQAYADCCDRAIALCRAAGLEPIPFIRIVSPSNRTPVPEAIIDIVLEKFEEIVVWEGETVPPADAPMMKMLQSN
jgi:hypothetical protein